MFPRPILLGTLVALCVTGSSAPAFGQSAKIAPVFSLQWKPKLGEIHLYDVNVTFDYGQTSLQFKSQLTVKVVAVSDDGGYTIQTSTSDAKVDSGTEVKDLASQSPETQYYSKVGAPTGLSLAKRDPDPFADLLDHLTEFESPSHSVKVGESWTNPLMNSKRGLFGAARLTYTLVDVYHEGGRHLAKIRYNASIGMDPEAASGTLILNRANNALFRLDATIPHFKPEGTLDESAISITIRELILKP
jgi:hypothetical protein